MALEQQNVRAIERERVAPHAAVLEAIVRRFDPDAHVILRPGHDPQFWELVAYVRPGTDDDPDLASELARAQTDILLDYDVAIAALTLPALKDDRPLAG